MGKEAALIQAERVLLLLLLKLLKLLFLLLLICLGTGRALSDTRMGQREVNGCRPLRTRSILVEGKYRTEASSALGATAPVNCCTSGEGGEDRGRRKVNLARRRYAPPPPSPPLLPLFVGFPARTVISLLFIFSFTITIDTNTVMLQSKAGRNLHTPYCFVAVTSNDTNVTVIVKV